MSMPQGPSGFGGPPPPGSPLPPPPPPPPSPPAAGGRNRTPPLAVIGVLAVVLIGGGVALALRGDDAGGDGGTGTGGGGSTTTASTAPTTTTTPAQGDEAEAEAVVRSYFQGVIDKDCDAIVGAASPQVFADAVTDQTPMQVCERASLTGMFDFDDYSLDGLEVIGNDGDTIRFTAYEMLDGTGYTETIIVSDHDGKWMIDDIV